MAHSPYSSALLRFVVRQGQRLRQQADRGWRWGRWQMSGSVLTVAATLQEGWRRALGWLAAPTWPQFGGTTTRPGLGAQGDGAAASTPESQTDPWSTALAESTGQMRSSSQRGGPGLASPSVEQQGLGWASNAETGMTPGPGGWLMRLRRGLAHFSARLLGGAPANSASSLPSSAAPALPSTGTLAPHPETGMTPGPGSWLMRLRRGLAHFSARLLGGAPANSASSLPSSVAPALPSTGTLAPHPETGMTPGPGGWLMRLRRGLAHFSARLLGGAPANSASSLPSSAAPALPSTGTLATHPEAGLTPSADPGHWLMRLRRGLAHFSTRLLGATDPPVSAAFSGSTAGTSSEALPGAAAPALQSTGALAVGGGTVPASAAARSVPDRGADPANPWFEVTAQRLDLTPSFWGQAIVALDQGLARIEGGLLAGWQHVQGVAVLGRWALGQGQLSTVHLRSVVVMRVRG